MKYLLVMLALASVGAQGTALSDLAAQMKPGDWRSLAANNMLAVFTGTGGSSNMINAYADALKWDPVGHRAYFLGSDHGGDFNESYRFVTYDESTNTWIRLTQPPWSVSPPGSYYDAHGYDKTAINPEARLLYRNPYNSSTVRVYNIVTGAWSSLPDASGGAACCDAIEYFPELDGLVRIAGSSSAILYSSSTRQWSTLGSAASLSSTWTIAEYNPVHKVMVLGSSTNALFKVNASGQVSPLKTMGASVYDGSAWNGVMTVDPVSGDYLVFTPTNRVMHVYDVTADSWKLGDRQPPATSLSGGSLNAAPISNYGVVLFAHCKSGCQTIVYKHSAGSAAETGAGVSRTPNISVSPNPFYGTTTLRLRGLGGALSVHDIRGREIARLFGNGQSGGQEYIFNAGNLPSGVYLARLTENGRTREARLMLMR